MILTTPDVNVVLMDFPSKKGNEMVVPNEDGSYTILINAGLNYESQLKAYEHAMSHITNDDFLKGNVQEIEYYAHHPHKDPEPAQIYLDRIKQLQAERRRLLVIRNVLNLFKNIAICSTELNTTIYMVMIYKI